MPQSRNARDVDEFLKSGLDLKLHLSKYLQISIEELESRFPKGSDELAALHPGSLKPEEAISFYEDQVGTAHLLDLASWHLNSANYIADTLRLQQLFAKGKVLDFGGGIGTHALAAAALPEVDHVYYVDLNPDNRRFVEQRANLLGLSDAISIYRDLENTKGITFDTVICLDVLEHLPDPSTQLLLFLQQMNKNSILLLNWYFFKGFNGEYPFHFDDSGMVDSFFRTLQSNFIEIFHPFLITARSYRPNSLKN